MDYKVIIFLSLILTMIVVWIIPLDTAEGIALSLIMSLGLISILSAIVRRVKSAKKD